MAILISTGLKNKILGKKINLVSNSDFATSASGWVGTDASLSITSESLTIVNDSNATGKATQAITVVPNRVYIVSAKVKAGTSSVRFKIGTSVDDSAYFTDTISTSTSFVEIKTYFVPSSNDCVITLENVSATAGDISYADDIFVYDSAYSLRDIFKNFYIKIYDGTPPSTPDVAPTGNELCTVSVDGLGNGLSFDDNVDGFLSKPATQDWRGGVTTSGTATYFRIVDKSDNGADSTIYERIQGTIGVSGDFSLSNSNLVSGNDFVIGQFRLFMY